MAAMAGMLGEAWRRLRAGRPVVVVSGLPRSGTSMMMRMLAAGGMRIVTDHGRAADEDNPVGYFELEQVKDLERGVVGWVEDARGAAVKVVSPLLRHLPPRYRYRVVFMERDLDEILASQRKMMDRRESDDGADDARLIERYREHLDTVRFQLGYRPWFATLFVNYRETITDPEATARRVALFVGGTLDVRAMAAAVDPALYRNRNAGR